MPHACCIIAAESKVSDLWLRSARRCGRRVYDRASIWNAWPTEPRSVPDTLKAIEAGDFDKLPSGIFARMFVKQFADAVGLDGASIRRGVPAEHVLWRGSRSGYSQASLRNAQQIIIPTFRALS